LDDQLAVQAALSAELAFLSVERALVVVAAPPLVAESAC
jgi:hypothetical protein